MSSFLLGIVACGAALAPLATFDVAGAGGHWVGAILHRGASLPIAVDLEATGGELSGTLDLPTWGIAAQPTDVTARAGGVVIDFAGAALDLELDAAAGSLRGELVAGDEDTGMTVELTRALAPLRPAIDVEEVELESADGVRLSGTILLPATGERCPGVVLVQGRSYGPRLQFRSHGVLAARRGVAAICFDGRGTGASGGERGGTTLANRIEDAEAALARLRAHPRVDADRVGMLGHSAGGWVAPVVAERTGDVAFVVLHSGPAVPLAEQQGQVVRELARLSDTEFTPEELDRAYRYQRDLAAMTIAGAEWPEIEAHVSAARSERWAAHVDLPESFDDAGLDYYRRCPHDSSAALRTLRIPVLALYGEEDFVVPPELNVPRLEELLTEAGNDDHQVVVFAGANHDLYLDAVDEEGRPYRWKRRPPGYFETLFDWIGERVR